MSARDRFSKKLTCPQCGHEGFADASEDDDAGRKNPGFSIDRMPVGFSAKRVTNRQETYIVACQCGRKFPFRAVGERET